MRRTANRSLPFCPSQRPLEECTRARLVPLDCGDPDRLELVYDALWGMLEDVYQIQALRDALEERMKASGDVVTTGGGGRDMRH